MKKYNVCMVGIGAVGTEIVRLLRKRNFPLAKLTAFATRERTEMIDGLPVDVKVATGPESFKGYDFAFFAGTEGAKGASKTLGWGAAEVGCCVVDNGDDFRMDPKVPLCIPEINADALKGHQNFIANPNCSTAIALMPLAVLHREAKIKRIVCCTYQAVSGSGSAAIRELEARPAPGPKASRSSTKSIPRRSRSTSSRRSAPRPRTCPATPPKKPSCPAKPARSSATTPSRRFPPACASP
jgi:aspartate-semialdehyde dehydrogenase